jgi:hypothetical protein
VAKQRQTDVNINYKVNVVDVEKGNETLRRASAATDKLRQDTQNFGNSAGKSFQSASKNIEGMEIQLARLRQQIRLVNTQDTARLNQLTSQYKQLKQQVDAYNKSLFESAAASKQNAQATQSMASQFGQVIAAAKAFIAVGFAREVVNLSLAWAKLHGNVEGVERAFAMIPNSVLLLNKLRDATHGTVTDLELMQRALMAQNFRIPLEKLGVLLEFAAVKAQQTGQEVNHLVDYIISGIGYRSIKRLDDLGFTANRVKEALGGVSLQAASMGQVMTAVTTLMNEDLQKTGGYAVTAATGVGQLETAWHELNVEVAKQGENGGFVKFLKDAVDAVRLFTKSGGNFNNLPVVMMSEAVSKMAQEQAASIQKTNEALKEQERLLDVDKRLFDLAKTLQGYEQQEAAGKTNIETLKAEITQLEEKNKSLFGLQKLSTEEAKQIESKKKSIEAIEQQSSALLNNKAILAEVIKLVVDYRNALTTKLPADTLETDGDGKRAMPARLNQVVELDLKHPVTGEIGKYDKDNIIKALTAMVDFTKSGVIPPLKQPVTVEITPMDGWDKIGEEFAERWKEIVSAGIQDTTAIINSFVEKEANSYQVQLDNLSAFYDTQMKLAGDNERHKMELAIKRDREEQKLRKKAFDAEKEAKRVQTVINGAAGIINAFATLPYPAAVVASLLIAGSTAAQLAIIQNQQYSGFKDGVIDLKGPGTKTSDSIPARLSKGESVMTADETRSSVGILKSIRAKKLNDKVIKEIVSGRSGGSVGAVFDDSRIIKKLDEVKNATPDVKRVGNLMYETKVKTEGYKYWIRSKSLNG